MSPDRTAPTTLRPSLAQRSAAPDTATPDGFAALLGAVDQAATPARSERRDPCGGTPPKVRERAERHEEPAATADPAQPAAAPADAPVPAVQPAAAGAPVLADPLPAVVTPAPTAADAPVAAVPVAPAVLAAEAVPATVPAQAVVAPAPVVPAVPAAEAPAAPVAEVALPVAEAPAAPLPQDAVPAPADLPLPDAPVADAAPAEPVAAADLPEVAAPAASSNPGGADAGSAGEQSAPREQPAAAAKPAESSAPAPSAPSSQPAQAASASAPLSGLSFAAQRTTPLHQAPRAVAQVIQVAQERERSGDAGTISHAKLNLRPVELGGIEIRLQSSSAGVTAQVIADSPEAAKLLQQAAEDLRRSLERQDVTLLSLDVSTAGDGRPGGSAGASADLAGDRARHLAAFGGAPEDADTADEVPAVVETVEIADGLHVDILA